MEPLRVIFVDDERSLLDGLRRMLRRKSDNWIFEFVDSGPKALERMEEQSFDVIISDMRMPGMNGVELLTTVKERFPKTIRFILSGFSDRNMILGSVGLAHQFFSKPCDPEQLIHAIRFSTSLYRHLGSETVQQILCGLKNLPTPPLTYTKMSEELNKPDPSIELLSDMVMQDSAISARVLQMVNSAFFGIGRSISDIAQATMFLGIENLRSLVLILGISRESFAKLESYFDLDLYTTHSIEVGTTAQLIAKDLGWSRKEAQSAFTAGLLHDMGRLIMATHFEELYCKSEPFSMKTPDTVVIQELEEKQFGANHAQLGAALLALWGLPPDIINAIAFHHKPQDDVEEGVSLSTIVHVANAIVYARKLDSHLLKDPDASHLLNHELLSSFGLESKIDEWIQATLHESNTPS